MDIIETLKAKGNFLKILRMQPMVAEQYNNCQQLLWQFSFGEDPLTMTIEIFNIVFLLRPVSFNNKSISKWIHNFISFLSDFSLYVQLSVGKVNFEFLGAYYINEVLCTISVASSLAADKTLQSACFTMI